MTFYNIIFGLLFVGAFREVVLALVTVPVDWPIFFLSTTVSIFVFSDAIYTSGVIEDQNHRYTVGMKLLDLASFVVLAFAVLLLNPDGSDMFDNIKAGLRLDAILAQTGLTAQAIFWALLAVYMVILIRWNQLLGIDRVMHRDRWVRRVQPFTFWLFAGMAVLSWLVQKAQLILPGGEVLLVWAGFGVTGFAGWYLLFYKRNMAKVLDAIVTLKPIAPHEVEEIRGWPKYQGDFEPLDYAMREGGWLDMFPQSSQNLRFGLWRRVDVMPGMELQPTLVGFALLVGITRDDAEMYIALRDDMIRKRIGREAVLQLIRYGFGSQSLKLKRIHLKVRVNHAVAIGLYEKCGFKKGRTFKAQANGVEVNFLEMEIFAPAPWLTRARERVRRVLAKWKPEPKVVPAESAEAGKQAEGEKAG